MVTSAKLLGILFTATLVHGCWGASIGEMTRLSEACAKAAVASKVHATLLAESPYFADTVLPGNFTPGWCADNCNAVAVSMLRDSSKLATTGPVFFNSSSYARSNLHLFDIDRQMLGRTQSGTPELYWKEADNWRGAASWSTAAGWWKLLAGPLSSCNGMNWSIIEGEAATFVAKVNDEFYCFRLARAPDPTPESMRFEANRKVERTSQRCTLATISSVLFVQGKAQSKAESVELTCDPPGEATVMSERCADPTTTPTPYEHWRMIARYLVVN